MRKLEMDDFCGNSRARRLAQLYIKSYAVFSAGEDKCVSCEWIGFDRQTGELVLVRSSKVVPYGKDVAEVPFHDREFYGDPEFTDDDKAYAQSLLAYVRSVEAARAAVA